MVGDSQAGFEQVIRDTYVKLEGLPRQRKSLRWIRLGVLVLIILVVVGGLWIMTRSVTRNVYDRREELLSETMTRAEGIYPKIERRLAEVGKVAIPKLQVELGKAQARAQRELPDVLHRNTVGLNERLNAKMAKQLQVAFDGVETKQKARLTEAFPKHFKCTEGDTPAVCTQKKKDLDRVVGDMRETYRAWAAQEMATTFNGHINAMNAIRETMTRFGDTVAPGKSMADAPQDVMTLFLELVGETFGGDSDLFEEKGVTDKPAVALPPKPAPPAPKPGAVTVPGSDKKAPEGDKKAPEGDKKAPAPTGKETK